MGNPVRVLHVVVNMNRGGAETLIMNLYRNIDRSKVQFDFLTCKEGVFDSEIKAMGGKIYRIPYVSEVGHGGYVRVLNRFFQAHSYYQIVHSHMDKMSGLVLRAAKKAGIRNRIAHSHNTNSEGGKAARIYKWYAGQFVETNATHFYACSHLASNWLYSKKVKSSIILKNGIEPEQFSYSDQIRKSVREELNIGDKTFVLGHVGRFARQKNHPFLIDLFNRFQQGKKDSVLILAGDGPYRSEMEKKVKELSLENNVKFIGIRSDINRILQAFDVFVFPSFHEGLPVTLVEAQAAGLPCFISDYITNEIDLGLNLIHQISLKDKRIWISELIEFAESRPIRKKSISSLTTSDYDIRKTATKLQNNYMKMGREVFEEVDGLHPHVQ
ncbi:glycosyltransferase family 1 protein [Pseudalkalibacillus hwajinpoensis]|uniref:glycosyltransferase family 1 protein n=1 Tax=Guptibacillus hwajinpoensis TaxID=208199 RepID=UPI00325B2636